MAVDRDSTAPPGLFAQIAELKRESSLRARVYPRLIGQRSLSPAKAAFQVRCLDAAIETLEQMQRETGRID